MNNEQMHALASIFWAAVPYFFIVATVQFFLLPGITEFYRQRLFDIRRELTLFAVRNGVSQKDLPLYRLAVTELCSAIRVAQIITFTRVVLLYPFVRGVGREETRFVDPEKIENMPLREAVIRGQRKLAKASVFFIIARSPLALVGFALAVFAAVFVAAFAVVARGFHKAWETFLGTLKDKGRQAFNGASKRVFTELTVDRKIYAAR